MTKRKMTDGERLAEGAFFNPFGQVDSKRLSESIDRLLRKRMAKAWDEGCSIAGKYGELAINPYRPYRKRKK